MLITAAIGIVSTAVTGWLGWFFGRKKSNAEVADMQLNYIRKMDDYFNKKIDDLITENKKLSLEIHQLKMIVDAMIDDACVARGCANRKNYTPSRLDEIFARGIKNKPKDKPKDNNEDTID